MSEIQIILPDDSVKLVEQGTTSGDIARSIGEGLFRASIAARVNGNIVDLESPINKNTNVEIITNKNAEAHNILMHSSAHLMAQAVKELYPQAKIAIGPALADRFYYDIDVDISINEEELEKIEKRMSELVKQDFKIERLELHRNETLKKFRELKEDYKNGEKFKKTILIFQRLDKSLFCPVALEIKNGYFPATKFLYSCFLRNFLVDKLLVKTGSVVQFHPVAQIT